MTWPQTQEQRGPHGEVCRRFDCPTHPRVFRLVQTDAEGAVSDLYYVEGLPNHWHTPEEAITASEENP